MDIQKTNDVKTLTAKTLSECAAMVNGLKASWSGEAAKAFFANYDKFAKTKLSRYINSITK